MRGDQQSVRFVGALFEHHSEPERLELPQAPLAADADSLDGELVAGEAQCLVLAGAAVADAKGEVEQGDIEAEKAADRPGAECQKKHTSGKADETEQQH